MWKKETYLNDNKEKVLSFARDLKQNNEISENDMNELYYNLYINKNKT
jgi:hypothetical protein